MPRFERPGFGFSRTHEKGRPKTAEITWYDSPRSPHVKLKRLAVKIVLRSGLLVPDEAETHSRLGEDIAGDAVGGLDLVPEVGDVDAQGLRV